MILAGTHMRRGKLYDVGYLKGRAKECRDMADKLGEAQGKMMLLDVAAAYEKLAETADTQTLTVVENKRRSPI